jgi:low affinity Fe/Cu permease
MVNQEKFDEVYVQLVDETENPNTTRDRSKMNLLSKLLDLMEYLQDNDDENPVSYWFSN